MGFIRSAFGLSLLCSVVIHSRPTLPPFTLPPFTIFPSTIPGTAQGKCDYLNVGLSSILSVPRFQNISVPSPPPGSIVIDLEGLLTIQMDLYDIHVAGINNLMFDQCGANRTGSYYSMKINGTLDITMGSYTMNGTLGPDPVTGNGTASISIEGFSAAVYGPTEDDYLFTDLTLDLYIDQWTVIFVGIDPPELGYLLNEALSMMGPEIIEALEDKLNDSPILHQAILDGVNEGLGILYNFTDVGTKGPLTSPPTTIPTTSDTIPTTTDIIPTTTIAAPTTTVAIPTTTVAAPTTTVAAPTTTVAIPTTTVAAPTTTVAIPTTTVAAPTTTVAAPTTTVAIPTTTVAAPTTTVAIPTTTVAAPTTTVAAPTTTVAIPTTTVAAPTTTVAIPTTTVAAPTTTVAAPTTTVAIPTTTVAAPTTTVAAPTTTVAIPTTTVAAPTTTVAIPTTTA